MTTTKQSKKDIDIPVGFETVPEEDTQAREKLTVARVSLLLKASFFGNMATRMPLVNADAWCPTAATDGRYFYYNSKFINMLRDKELEFLFGHEVLHNVYDHIGATKLLKRNPTLSNIAQDYVINRDLVVNNIGELITTVSALYDRKFDGWGSDEVYDYLYENAEKVDIDQLADMLVDEHLDDQESKSGEGEGAGGKPEEDENGNLKSKSRPKYSEEERKKIKDEIKESLINSAKQSGAGKIPASVKRIVQDLTEPKMDWRELLAMSIESTVKSDYSFQRRSRKASQTNCILPGMIPEQTIDIAIALDMSGSISDAMGRDMLSEVKGIMEQFQDFRIQLWCFDTQVYSYAVFDPSNIDDIDTYNIIGGGGTDFMCNWRYMVEEDIQPERFIMFTDGEPWDSWGDENYCDTVFVIHGSEDIVPPFGNHAYYDNKS
jgi:predicted metal-dependent peptidase